MELREFIDIGLKKGMLRSELIDILIQKGYSKKEIDAAFGTKKDNKIMRKEESGLSHMQKIGKIFSNPFGFFDEVREDSIKNSFLLYLFSLLIVMGVGVIFAFLFGMMLSGVSRFSVSSFIGFIFYPIMFVLGLAATFVYAGIVHLMMKMFNGRGSFTDSYNACTYSLIPVAIISVVPLLGFLGIIYGIVLMTFGLSKYHEISKGKAIISACAPVFVFILLLILFIVLLISAFSGPFF